MTTSLKQRIVGAIFILSLGVILIPLVLDMPQEKKEEVLSRVMPEAPALPDVSEVSKIHYEFNDATSVAAQTAEPTPEVAAPVKLAEVDNTVSVEEPPSISPVKTTQAQQKAKATLAQATQAQWTIQLGAFSSEENAKALMQKLSAQGFSPYLRKMANDSLVRVYVSPGVPRGEAIALVSKLDTELGLKGIVVRYFQ